MAAVSECTDTPVASQKLARHACPTRFVSDTVSRVMQLWFPDVGGKQSHWGATRGWGRVTRDTSGGFACDTGGLVGGKVWRSRVPGSRGVTRETSGVDPACDTR